jgi:hypothetical protein
MMSLDQWVYRMAALAMLIGIAETLTEKMKLFALVQWLLRAVLLWQMLLLLDGLIGWMKGGI